MVMGGEDKTLTKKEQTAQKLKKRLLERLAKEKERDLALTHSNADFSLSSSDEGSGKEDNHEFVPVSGVAIGGSAGSRNRGPRPLGAPDRCVSLVRQAMSTSHCHRPIVVRRNCSEIGK